MRERSEFLARETFLQGSKCRRVNQIHREGESGSEKGRTRNRGCFAQFWDS